MKQAHVIGGLVLHLALASTAVAQESTEPPATEVSPEAEPAEYRPLIDRALAESRETRWEEARALFRRANEIYPNARALRGVGMTSFELRDYAACVRALRSSLAHSVLPLTSTQRTQVEALLTQALLFVGSYSLALPPDVTFTLDERPLLRESDGTVLLGLGAHHATASNPDGRVVSRTFDVHGGESGPLPFDFTPLARVETVDEPSGSVPITPAPHSENTDAAVALLISGGAIAVAGGVCLALGLSDASTVSGAARGTEWADVSEAYERGPILEAVGATALGVGVVMAGLGAVLFATSPSEPVQVQVQAQGLSVRGVW